MRIRKSIFYLISLVNAFFFYCSLCNMSMYPYDVLKHRFYAQIPPSTSMAILGCILLLCLHAIAGRSTEYAIQKLSTPTVLTIIAWIVSKTGPTLTSYSIHLFYLLIAYIFFLIIRECKSDFSINKKVAHICFYTCTALFFFWSLHTQYKLHNSLYSHFSDIGFWFLRLQNTIRYGDFLRLSSLLPTYWDHFCPGLAILLPFFYFYPKIELLLWVQSLSIAATPLVVVWIAKKMEVPLWSRVLLGMIVFIYPAMSYMTINMWFLC